jgi:hypothetical protein
MPAPPKAQLEATIRGRVTDRSGGIIPGAVIVATHEGMGILGETTTGPDGTFLLPQLAPGRYTVTATVAGFQQLDRTGVMLQAGSIVDLDLELALGALLEMVIVDSARLGDEGRPEADEEQEERTASRKSVIVDSATTASRVFAGPGQYPPSDFQAYGIIAFRSSVTSESRLRYLAICQAYLSTIPAASVLEDRGVALGEQMATIWPLQDGSLSDELNESGDAQDRCSEIVSAIDIITSRHAITNATRSNERVDLSDRGPYLIAWSPSTAYGRPETAVLIGDLSNVTTLAEAIRVFSDWAVDIEQNPDLWSDGWDSERVRAVLRQWADRWGRVLLRVFGLEEA